MVALFAFKSKDFTANYIFMHKRCNIFLKSFLFLLSIGLSFSSCQKGELNLSDDFINSDSYTALIDTVSVQFSTIRADSIVTSSTGNGLVGYYHHPLMGGQEAKTYFAFNSPNEFNWDETNEVFDSLVMVLHPNAYSIGDTAIDAKLQVNALSQKIEADDAGQLYNTSSFAYVDESIGHTLFRPFPKEKEKVTIRLSNAYAMDIINFLVTHENHDDKHTLFKEQFKGVVVNCDTNITRSVLGFSVNDTSAYLRLYSHISGLEKQELSKDFALSSGSEHFNQISSPNQAVIYNQIKDGKAVLKTNSSNNTALLQSGSGLKIRIDFPSLNNLLELKSKGHIIKAELRLKPNMDIMKTSDLPNQVYIGDIYIANDIWGYLLDSDEKPLKSVLNLDYLYHEETYYTFDLTYYINSRLTGQVVDIERGLVITLPDTHMGSSYTWLAINGQGQATNQSKLLLYYYYYDTE